MDFLLRTTLQKQRAIAVACADDKRATRLLALDIPVWASLLCKELFNYATDSRCALADEIGSLLDNTRLIVRILIRTLVRALVCIRPNR